MNTRTPRMVYSLAALFVMLLGLSSRRYRDWLPAFVAEYAGDVLWSLMVYLIASALLATARLATRAAIALALAVLIEISQLCHPLWLDRIRQTTLGGLVLGFGFLWSDLVCYAIGILGGAGVEWILRRSHARRDAAENAARRDANLPR